MPREEVRRNYDPIILIRNWRAQVAYCCFFITDMFLFGFNKLKGAWSQHFLKFS